MPKDNENISLPDLTEIAETPSQPPFAPDQMVRCDSCLRANPPTRVNCLYCGVALPASETTASLQRPALRPLEEWEQGYNNILLPPAPNLGEASLAEAADLLRLRLEDLTRILNLAMPLPLARAATVDEAQLVQRRLVALGFRSIVVADRERNSDSREVIKVRAIDIDEEEIYAYQTPDAPAIQIRWTDVVLIATGRLLVRRVELKEEKGKRAENRILDASEFATDETAMDFYQRDQASPYRITSNGFDFSCLGSQKGLVAGENMDRLIQVFRERAPNAEFDDKFNAARKALEAVWPSGQQSGSSGWRRERPGKISLSTVTELNNEMQFLRYSRLRYHLLSNPPETTYDAQAD